MGAGEAQQRPRRGIVDVQTGSLRRLTSEPVRERFPAWSPDGRTIAVPVVAQAAPGRDRVVLVDGSSGAERPFGDQTFQRIGFLGWLPDQSGVVVDAAPTGLGPAGLAPGELVKFSGDTLGISDPFHLDEAATVLLLGYELGHRAPARLFVLILTAVALLPAAPLLAGELRNGRRWPLLPGIVFLSALIAVPAPNLAMALLAAGEAILLVQLITRAPEFKEVFRHLLGRPALLILTSFIALSLTGRNGTYLPAGGPSAVAGISSTSHEPHQRHLIAASLISSRSPTMRGATMCWYFEGAVMYTVSVDATKRSESKLGSMQRAWVDSAL